MHTDLQLQACASVCPYSRSFKLFLLLTASSEAPQRVLKLNYTSIQNKSCIKQAVPPFYVYDTCHVMKQKTSCLWYRLMKIPSVKSHEQEVGWIKGSPSISGALCATRSRGKITGCVRSKVVQLPWPPLAKNADYIFWEQQIIFCSF